MDGNGIKGLLPGVQITERIIIIVVPMLQLSGNPKADLPLPDQSDNFKAGNFYRTMPIAS